jgi:hypothetical protein
MTEGKWRIIEASDACLACERSCARLWHLSLLDLPGRGHRMWCLALVWRRTQHPRLRPYCRYDSHTRTLSNDKCHAVAPSTGRQPVAMFDVLWQLAMFANVISPISPVVKMLQSYVTYAQPRRLKWWCGGTSEAKYIWYFINLLQSYRTCTKDSPPRPRKIARLCCIITELCEKH